MCVYIYTRYDTLLWLADAGTISRRRRVLPWFDNKHLVQDKGHASHAFPVFWSLILAEWHVFFFLHLTIPSCFTFAVWSHSRGINGSGTKVLEGDVGSNLSNYQTHTHTHNCMCFCWKTYLTYPCWKNIYYIICFIISYLYIYHSSNSFRNGSYTNCVHVEPLLDFFFKRNHGNGQLINSSSPRTLGALGGAKAPPKAAPKEVTGWFRWSFPVFFLGGVKEAGPKVRCFFLKIHHQKKAVWVS